MDPGQDRDAWRERYRRGFFLAPMVRVGTLPMRLLSLQYGADLVWTCEVIDKSIVGCTRTVDDKTGAISYMKNDRTMFTTHPDEKAKVVFQMGAASPELAAKAAQAVEQDVSGIDLNCGCPVKFSVHGGMGAALLDDPDRLCAILTALVQSVSIPVTCKIRVLPDEEQTLALVRRIAATGISALTVHCRTRDMRPREPAMWHRLDAIVREVAPLPVVLNGDVFAYDDVRRGMEATGACSAMTARGAAANPSIFSKDGPVARLEACAEYVKAAVRVSNAYHNTKYTLMQMHPETRSDTFRRLQGSRCYADMCAAMGLADFYESEGRHLVNSRAEPTPKRKGAGKRRDQDPTSDVPTAADTANTPPKRLKA
ncbi:tRNA-dihydrouridine synthase 2 [Coemansia sp. RSA 552]|nr:tRNA-dihydrouridine synthase 2 [Coemansia sp. RSA 552]